MVRGGKRENAGRKAAAPTATVRVPESGAAVARGLVELITRRAQEELMETEWYRSAPAQCRVCPPEVRLLGIEGREVVMENRLLTKYRRVEPHVLAEATVGGFVVRFVIALEAGRLGASIEDERAA